jgi:hypothetical protein
MISRRAAVSAAALLLLSAPAFAQGGDPAAIVRSIYRGKDLYGAQVALQMRAVHSDKVLSQSLAKLWTRSDDETPAEDEPVPGFDIASNSQGMEVARADVTVERQDRTHATVVARLTPKGAYVVKSPAQKVVRYDFVREAGRWKIDDVRSHNGEAPWSLKQTLTEALRP